MKIKFTILLLFIGLIACSGNKNDTSSTPDLRDFEWDFTTKKKHSYSFNVSNNTKTKWHRDSSFNYSKIAISADISIESAGNNVAKIIAKQLNSTAYELDENLSATDSLNQIIPSFETSGLQSNSFLPDEGIQQIILDMIIPLPQKDIEQGERFKLPITSSMDVQTQQYPVIGFNDLLFKGFETVNNRKCAVLEGEISASRLDLPDSLVEIANLEIQGTGSYYFDIKNHMYVAGSAHVVISTWLDNQSDISEIEEVFMEMETELDIDFQLNEAD